MNSNMKKVLAVSIVFALVGLYSTNVNNSTLTDTNALILAAVSYAGVVVALAWLDKTPSKCFEDKIKASANKAIVPTILLVALQHPKTYKWMNDNTPKDLMAVPLMKELTSSPTLEGVGLHTALFALVYYLAVTKLHL
jgi:hypothetical protein